MGVEPVSESVDSSAPTEQSWFRRIYRHSLTRFLAFAALGFTIDVTLLFLLDYFTPLPLWASVTIAFWITYSINFVMNRFFAFDAAHRDLSGQLTRFIPQVLIDFGLTLGGVELYTYLGASVIMARVIAGATNAIFNYVIYRWWTFGGSQSRMPAATPTTPQ